jgi:hypothetical protein
MTYDRYRPVLPRDAECDEGFMPFAKCHCDPTVARALQVPGFSLCLCVLLA